ncbi:excinuclease ABC subunit C [Candidatus Magnetoovum chiemensis]|nr:excinuclease ABC subunit C [Candidatus Magnetoovum chiemensis]
MVKDDFLEKSDSLPDAPGVYLFKDARQKVLYVGKAKSLKNRVRSYFTGTNGDARKSAMVKEAASFTFVVTENELEALVLEANFIKQYRPGFNVVLRDDKNYPYLRVTVQEKWPKVEIVRKIINDGSVYIGPYVSSRSLQGAFDFIRKNFPVRTCNYNLESLNRPCIEYQIGQCAAPCVDYIAHEQYVAYVDEVIDFLKGRKKELLDKLVIKMRTLSDNLMFEEAAVLRDRIKAIEQSWSMQKAVSPEFGDIDVIAFYQPDTLNNLEVMFNVFFIRSGVIIGVKDFYIKNSQGLSSDDLIYNFIVQFYNKEILPPCEIIAECTPSNVAALKQWLKDKSGCDVEITAPNINSSSPIYDKKASLLKMAKANAKTSLELRYGTGSLEILEELTRRLRLPSIPNTIGAFDISTTFGTDSVGAFICWQNGRFKKDLYRHLKIKTISGIDDYGMMKETITRVLLNLKDQIPDLLIIDGGTGQLEKALEALEALELTDEKGNTINVKNVKVIAIAKNPDRVFSPEIDEPIDIEDASASSFLLKRIRDEVHRFAIAYHRQLRAKRMLQSPLEKIKGVSSKRRLELLRNFKSLDAIRCASVEEIASIKGFNKTLAQKILDTLNSANNAN